ncbi:RnfABCDGE type electron transport complex subunit D [Treponema sp.]|uniref:RnfABCDGE type electron transport complex subunit D n=1 Tax=Treponema sp. TaxID=166 RepID=UPI0025DC210B|nr:RnfABCDGE type electron transport complex subunit D [Treponema sp.]MCR5217349.1 RnfABCDGE type electron transport complex subunit D [Treponema sp.]
MQTKIMYKKHSITLTPFIYLTPSVSTSSKIILSALILQVIGLAVTRSFSALITTACPLAASILCEAAFRYCRKNYKYDYVIAVIQGLLTGLLVPQTYPPVIVFITALLCFAGSKYVFGNFAASWVNPSALTIAMLFFLDSSFFPGFEITAHSLQSRNAALNLIQNGSIKTFSFDYKITDFLNKNIFSFFKIAIPDGYISMIVDSGSFIPAFRFNLLTIISLVLFISYSIIDYIIPGIFIMAYMLLVRLLLPVFINGTPLQGDMILALFSSGTLFYATYLIQWYGTAPLTRTGKCLYGFAAAIFAFITAGFGTSAAGMVFVVLMLNLLSPLIQYFENKGAQKCIKKNLLPKVEMIKETENV